MATENKIILGNNHKRSLSVVARHIEKSLDDIEDLLTNERRDKLTEKIITTTDENTRKKLLILTKLIREKNEQMFYDLELNAYNYYDDRILRSNISHIWTLLCDSTPEKLKNYGDLSDEQVKLINTHVNNLLETVNKMQDIIF